MSPAEILRAAAELVERPGAWTQGVAARRSDDTPCAVHDGVKWCAIGACNYVCPRHRSGTAAAVQAIYDLVLHGESVGDWNDAPGRTAAEVAEAMRRAAASLDAGGAA